MVAGADEVPSACELKGGFREGEKGLFSAALEELSLGAGVPSPRQLTSRSRRTVYALLREAALRTSAPYK